jgi:integrase
MHTQNDVNHVNFLATRNWALFNLLAHEKLPVVAVLSLLVSAVNLASETLALPRKTVHLGKTMLEVLRAYLETFACLLQPDTPLFPSRSGKFIDPPNYRYKILQPHVEQIAPDYVLKSFHPADLPPHILHRLLKNPNEVENLSAPDAMVCKLLYWLGLRPGEFAHIRKCDIDFDRELIVLRQTKSGHDQQVPLPAPLIDELRAIVSHMQPEEIVFKNKTGRPIDRGRVADLIKRWGAERGIENLTPRDVRRSVATHLEDREATPIQVESLLRHSGSSTLRRHYSVPSVSRAREALKYHIAYELC